MDLFTGLYVHGKLLGLAVQRALVGTIGVPILTLIAEMVLKYYFLAYFIRKCHFGFQVGVCWPKKKS